jgi:hypothetical protein
VRLTSSGIDQSPLRKPASTWATSAGDFAPTSAAASVELTSPTTTTASGLDVATIGSRAIITRAVCSACVPDPMPRWKSGGRRPSSSKKTPSIDSS